LKGAWLTVGIVVIISFFLVLLLFLPIEPHSQTYTQLCARTGEVVPVENISLPSATIQVQWNSTGPIWLVISSGRTVAYANGAYVINATSGSGTFSSHGGTFGMSCLTTNSPPVVVTVLLQYSTPLL
jgi:hypothetical protein